MIFHIDANSFYASCERLFRPDLDTAAIIVLSNNDGIIIALNNEAKELGLVRGDAWFKVREMCKAKGVHVFSSNYTLYADISSRLVSIYNRLCPEVEVYSIDECFLYFPDWNSPNYEAIAFHIRDTVLKEIGLAVSVGIGPSKTLAKLCNKLAKKRDGVYMWNEAVHTQELASIPIGSVWGIGRSKTKTLARLGLKTALDLRNLPLHLAKKHLTITGMYTVQELQGVATEHRIEASKCKNICSSKSFRESVYSIEDLEEALSSYTMEAVSRLRSQKSAAQYVAVYLMTNSWDSSGPQYFNHLCIPLAKPSSFLPDILSTAKKLLHSLYREGYGYKKVMVHLLGLKDDVIEQEDLFESSHIYVKKQELMQCFDTINARYGRNTLKIGLDKKEPKKWSMQRNYLSPSYTTDEKSLPMVR